MIIFRTIMYAIVKPYFRFAKKGGGYIFSKYYLLLCKQ